MTVQNPSELARVERFALKCYGWNLNLFACATIIRMARFDMKTDVKTNLNMKRVLRNIARGYKEIMEYVK